MDDVSSYLHYADIAFANKQYTEAFSWYQKVLDVTPDDLAALSRAGAICVTMGQFDAALGFFGRARELDPQNGDNHFNYGNACFFRKNFADAFTSYVEAEKNGCSEDVTPRLYYQMALLCSLRQDTKSALIYFRKCEESDSTGELSLNPDLISEKLKLYMMIEDYGNAGKMAEQLVAIQPTQFRSYMVYFSILMAHKDYTRAEKLLTDAGKYAETTPVDRVNIALQTASLYAAMGEAEPRERDACYRKAIDLLESMAASEETPASQLVNVLLTLAEVYEKAGMPELAISRLRYILEGDEKEVIKPAAEGSDAPDYELTPEEIDEMIHTDLERIQMMLLYSDFDGDIRDLATVEYDEAGYPVATYDESVFEALHPDSAEILEEMRPDPAEESRIAPSPDQRERALFLMMSAYLAKDGYEAAGKIAAILKHSGNKSYAYYGLYISALADRKLNADPAAVSKKYAEAIAFFRNKMFSDHSDSLAAVFRARLYAEDGKTEKAKEIAKLLAEADQKAVLDYIDSLAPSPSAGH